MAMYRDGVIHREEGAPATPEEEEALFQEAAALSLPMTPSVPTPRIRPPPLDAIRPPPVEPRPDPPVGPPPVEVRPMPAKARPPMREPRPTFPAVGQVWSNSPLAQPIFLPVRPTALLPLNGPPRPERFAYFPAAFEAITDSDDDDRSDVTSTVTTAPSHHYQ